MWWFFKASNSLIIILTSSHKGRWFPFSCDIWSAIPNFSISPRTTVFNVLLDLLLVGGMPLYTLPQLQRTEYTQFLVMLNSVGSLTEKRYLKRVEPLSNTFLMSYGLHIFWSLLIRPMTWRQWTIPFCTLYGWWELKLRYCPVKVGLWYTNDLNTYSVCATNTLRKGNSLSCSFSIVNSINDQIEFVWSSDVWTSSWWGKRMNVSSTYLSHIDGFSYGDPNAVSLKYSMFANTDGNGEPIG